MLSSVYPWLLSHKIILSSHGRGHSGPCKCFPKVTCTVVIMSWEGSPRSVLVFLPHTTKIGSMIDDIITCEDWPLL